MVVFYICKWAYWSGYNGTDGGEWRKTIYPEKKHPTGELESFENRLTYIEPQKWGPGVRIPERRASDVRYIKRKIERAICSDNPYPNIFIPHEHK